MKITDEQILSILKLSELPEVNSVEVRQTTGRRNGRLISVSIHVVNDDISPAIAAFKQIVPVEFKANDPYELTHPNGDKELIKVHRFDGYPTLSVDAYEIQRPKASA
ncbi:hypothetical protein [Desulfitobacterium chlororespirans]|uniref:Uncharacterized protein n=1 Tax=Desulfitobacterium chlororespirans DSM 11544 TaxID=1121395 RepID=A0A1M7U405_9FIRM|nr:hypothetical protein [Desulfitobacterium chlororespirans]SHN77610.1 hypothetical protein SAMN02745215_02911 [Desulfitobacterium chlororespirans DSM 11544]